MKKIFSSLIFKSSIVFQKIKVFIANLLFPIECLSCSACDTLLCGKCLENIPCRLHQPRLSSGIRISVVYNYSLSLIKKTIPRAKYYHRPELFIDITLHGLRAFAEIFAEEKYKNAILVPVPLHFFRYKKRGFNQSEIIAQCIADNFIDLRIEQIILRQKNTPQQARLKKHERQKNIQNAFSLNISLLKKSNIGKNTPLIIIDDVISTGSTIMEIEKVLRNAGFTNVSALGLCRGG